MRKVLHILLLACFTLGMASSYAQSSAKGFDYAAHKKLNKKASRWGKSRVKAADHDLTNMQCSTRKTRRHARKSKH